MEQQQIRWTIQAVRGEARGTTQEFSTKAEAVMAMEVDREPKTAIRCFGRHYVYTPKK